MTLLLSEKDRAFADGHNGGAAAFAMRLIIKVAGAMRAKRLIDITSAHIDGCLYHGDAGLDFAERLANGGGRVVVPTTLNVATLDRLHPELFRGDDRLRERGGRLMDAYESMGCRPTWTCAPYQLALRPGRGEQVAWAESNAIVFVNSVLGARTDRYGDFIDICAALTGRVPDAGLHRTENRLGEVVYRLTNIPPRLIDDAVLYPVLGHLIGFDCGTSIPVIVGLPPDSADEDRLKALGAGAASSGSVALFHAVGITPEAPTLADALGGVAPKREVAVDAAALRHAWEDLSTTMGGRLSSVHLGTPHASLAEFERLAQLVAGRRFSPQVDVFVNTGRDVLREADEAGLTEPLLAAGGEIVTDTCTYITPIMRRTDGVVMTDSAKWAYYAPSNLGVDVAFGSMADCIASAEAGHIVRDEAVWGG